MNVQWKCNYTGEIKRIYVFIHKLKDPFTATNSTYGTIHLRRWQIFTNFNLFLLPSADFHYYPLANLANFWPFPLKNADVLNVKK